MSVEKEKTNFKGWLVPSVVIGLAGVIASWIMSCAQIKSAERVALNQQRLYALQFFSDKLTSNRFDRELALGLINSIDDPLLIEKLTDISNRAVIDLNADSLWVLSEKSRENAIIEYAKLYNKYPKKVIKVLSENVPDKKHINYWPPVISISKFFFYLVEYDTINHGLWYGTAKDSMKFALLKESKYYYDPSKDLDSINVPKFLDIGLGNFREIAI